MTYRIDLKTPDVLTPCTFVPSTKAPGKTLCINADGPHAGHAIVVEPNGDQVRTEAPDSDNFDSPWTQATVMGDFLVYHSTSDNPPDSGTPRGYRIVT